MGHIRDFSLDKFTSYYINSLCPGYDNLNIYSEEVISELIRRVSCNLCPCSKTKLQRAVIDLIEDLLPSDVDVTSKVIEVFEDLIALGDLIELPPISEDVMTIRNQIYLSPLKYIKINDNRILLIGVHNSIIGLSEIHFKMRLEKSLKIISPDDLNFFKGIGYYELSLNEWLKFEKYNSPQEYLKLIQNKLELLPIRSEKLNGITILDDKTGSNYYKGRWSELNPKHMGCYVGRRKVQYGSDLWCYLDVKDNLVLRFLDLPVLELHWRPFDEAWRIQMAIDFLNNTPQKYRIREESNENIIIDFFSPVPAWTVRQLEVNGKKYGPDKCLFSYSIKLENFQNVEAFLIHNLWMQKINS